MLKYETLLDLAAQRLAAIAASPNRTREAREVASGLLARAKEELDAFNAGQPFRRLERL